MKITKHLNDKLRQYNLKEVNSTVFSVAFSSTQARLYTTWKEGDENF